MKKFFIIFILGLLMPGIIFSQTFYGTAADSLITGCTYLKKNPTNQLISFISLRVESAISFSEHKNWLANAVLPNADYEFTEKDEISFLDITHVKYNTHYLGIPIEGAEYVAHIKNNKLVSANGLLKNVPDIDIIPDISEKEAFDIIMDTISATTFVWEIFTDKEKPEPELTILPLNGNFILTYKAEIISFGPIARSLVYVNANSGNIVKMIDEINMLDEVGTAYTKYNGTVDITTKLESGTYYLEEEGRGNGITTNAFSHYSPDGTNFFIYDITDDDNVWDVTSNNANAAYDIHFGTEQCYDYFSSEFTRNSYDDNGAEAISIAHFKDWNNGNVIDWDNAAWMGSYFVYGDGLVYFNPLTAIDIVAHEYTHAVTQYSADLEYEKEYGALNEGFSDIFAVAIDFYVNGSSANYTIGEQVSKTGNPLRSLSNPNLYGLPDTYKGNYWIDVEGCIPDSRNDYCGVHTNNGVLAYWFYLLCEGGVGVNDNGDNYDVTAIGMDNAIDLAYLMLTGYLTKYSDYHNARDASILATRENFVNHTDLISSIEAAWDAVGVYGASEDLVADFYSGNQSVVTGINVSFTDQSTGSITSWSWGFGDGSTSSEQNPTHSYGTAGTYTVSLTVEDNEGNTDTETKTDYITVLETGAYTYKIGDQAIVCEDVELCDGQAKVCIPLNVIGDIGPGIIGMDFCFDYDDTYLEPTGNVTIGDVVLNGSANADYAINYTQDPGKVHVSVFYNSIGTAEFTGEGEIACVEFLVNENYIPGTVLDILSCELNESYATRIEEKTAANGSLVIENEDVFTGTVVFWDDQSRPLANDLANPGDLSTYISGTDDNCVITHADITETDELGEFVHDLNNGNYIRITRDTPEENDILPVINGEDCYWTSLVTTMNSAFLPKAFQVVAMDVNGSGTVEAGDISHIQDRILDDINVFPINKDWAFVDNKTVQENDDYIPSSIYPLDNDEGYSKYNVPAIPGCMEIDVQSNEFCSYVDNSLYHGIMIGDATGNWNEDGTNANLKSTSIPYEVQFDLEHAVIKDNQLFIPVLCNAGTITSFDFAMEDFDTSKLEPVGIEGHALNQNNTNMAWNTKMRFTSYAKIAGGISAYDTLIYVKLNVLKKPVDKSDLGTIVAYVNGNKAGMNSGTLQPIGSTDSIESAENEAGLQVFPNPSGGRLTVKANDETVNVTINDIFGNTVYHDVSNSGTLEVDITGQPKGTYVLKIQTGSKAFVKKIIIQ